MRRSRLAAGLILLCLLVVGLAAYSGSDVTGAAARDHASKATAHPAAKSPGLFAKKLVQQARREARKREKARKSPKAVAARKRSRTAYQGQTASEALATLREEFPKVAKLRRPTTLLPRDGRMLRYLKGDRVGVILADDEDDKQATSKKGKKAKKGKRKKGAPKQRRRLVVSSLPLRRRDEDTGKLALTSIELVGHGAEYVPKNAPADIAIGKKLGRGISLKDSGVTVRPIGARLDAVAHLEDQRLFWANVTTDTDFVVTMRTDGVETYNVLRSRRAGERIPYEVDLPEGATTEIDAGTKGIAVKDREGKVLVVIAPPAAADADGRAVPAKWVINGTTLEIVVEHRRRDLLYPIVVDPTMVDLAYKKTSTNQQWVEDGSENYGGWSWAESNPGALGKSAGSGTFGRSLAIWMNAGVTSQAWMWGAWEFRAPGDTYVARFEANHLNWIPAGGRSCLSIGLMGADNPVRWDNARLDYAGYADASPYGQCAYQRPSGINDAYQIHSLQLDNWSTVTRGNMAAVQWWTPVSQNGANSDFIMLGGAVVEIIDDRPPTNVWQTGLPGGWTNNPMLNFRAYASDAGFGQQYLGVLMDDDNNQLDGQTLPNGVFDTNDPHIVGEQFLNCWPNPQLGVRCPTTQWTDVNKLVSNGIHNFSMYAFDAMINRQTGAGVARVDTLPPLAPRLSGSAYDLRGFDVGEPSYPLHVDGLDDIGSPAGPRAGIGLIELLVDGQVKDYRDQGCDADCLAGTSANLSADFSFNTQSYSEGTHTLKVRVTDRAGNSTMSDPWTLTVVGGTVASPRAGARIVRRATLQAHTARQDESSVQWQWRVPATSSTPAGAWTTIPKEALRTTAGVQLQDTAVTVANGGDSNLVSWNILATPGISNVTQQIEVRGVFGGGAPATTNASRFTFDTRGMSSQVLSEEMGPGKVNMITGNFAITEKDVSIAAGVSDLNVTRTYNSRDTTVGPLGRGWSLDTSASGSFGAARLTTGAGGYVEVTFGDGTVVPFSATGSGFQVNGGYEQYSLKQQQITTNGITAEYVLTDTTTGTTVTFRSRTSDTSVAYAEVTQLASSRTLNKTTYETPSPGQTRINKVYAMMPSGTDCDATFVKGCRRLNFVYASATTAQGDYAGRLSHIDYEAWDPAQAAITNEPIQSYSYDSTGRLQAAWDPRVPAPLKTTYGYDSAGLLSNLTPPGQQPWTLTYQSMSGESEPGRLKQASRTGPAGPAIWTAAYNLPVSGTGSTVPKNLAPDVVDDWGQTDIPTDAMAIFPPEQVPTLPATDFSQAVIHYLNRDAYEVNTAVPGSVMGVSRIETTERDQYGNVVRELSAGNRGLALSTGTDAEKLAKSRELDTQRQYQSKGLELVNELGPLHTVRLNSGEIVPARKHTTITYDQNKPDSRAYHLATTKIVAASVAVGGPDADARVTTLAYDWNVRKPITQIVNNGGTNLTTRFQYDAETGDLTLRRQPSSSSDTAGTTQYVKYTAQSNPVASACGYRPEWDGMPCMRRKAVQTTSTSLPKLLTKTYTYDKFGRVKTETDAGDSSRTTTTTYDAAGRETSVAVSGGGGTAVPTKTTTYDVATGRVATESATINGIVRTIQKSYNSIGQLASYTDGTGQVTTSTYDLSGNLVTSNDGKGTQTRTYDPVTGLVATMTDSQAGTFSATYDGDGHLLTKTLPGGMKAVFMYDAEGQPYDLTWTKTTGCSSDCNWLHFSVTRSIHGQQRSVDGTTGQKTYTYDGAGRLIEGRDTPTGAGCTLHRYSFDVDSNRTYQATYKPDANGACNQLSANLQSSANHTYDAADRLTDSGVVYDAFNRMTAIPAGDAGGRKLTVAYFADDRMRSETQAGKTTTYDLDPTRRILQRTMGSETEISHYGGEDDSPTWTSTSSGHWSRGVSFADGLGASVDDKQGTVLQLTDLHGDVAATAATSSTAMPDSRVLQAKRTGSNWTVTSTRSLTPGSYVAKARLNDASGNVGTATTKFKVTTPGPPDRLYQETVSNDEPEAYWRLGETSGAVGADQMTPAHPLTYTGGPTLAQAGVLSGDPNTSVKFDGVDDSASAIDQPWRAGSGQFSAETWFKTTSGGTLMSQGGPSLEAMSWYAKVETLAGANQGKVRAFYFTGTRAFNGYSAGRVDDGRWHHLVVVFSGEELRVVVDGVSTSTAASAVGTAPTYAWDFDEGSGSVAKNTGYGAGGNGTISGATWTDSGRLGRALNFTPGATVSVADQPGLRATTALTVEAWVKPTGNPAYPYGTIVSKSGSSATSSSGWGLHTYYTGAPMGMVGSSGTYHNTMLPPNAWTHVAMTWTANGSEYLFVNGNLVNTITNVPVPSDFGAFGGGLTIGGYSGSSSFTGTIDEVKVYQRSLSQSEIVTDMSTPARSFDRGRPVAAFGAESATGSVLTDMSGGGRNVTLTGTTPWSLGKFGQALGFNGTNYGAFNDGSLGNNPQGLTLSAWLKPIGYNASMFLGQSTFGLVGPASATSGPGVCVSTTCVRAPATTLNAWTHLTATWDRATLRLYVDGVLAGSAATTAAALSGGTVFFGRDVLHNTTAYVGGTVDEIRVYPRVITSVEMSRDASVSVSQNIGATDPNITLGKRATVEPFSGQMDEPAVYSRSLSDAEIAEHYRVRSNVTSLAAPSISQPAAGATVADATPNIVGTGSDDDGVADNVRVELFTGTDTSAAPVQSLMAPRGGANWGAESAKGLAAGTYTAKVTQNDNAGSFNSATRTFTVSGATDPETGYATSVRSDSPAAYWRLGETSGTTAVDDRTSHPGTYGGGPTLGGSGALSNDNDKAPTFDGLDDKVDAPNTGGFWDPGTADFSVEAWVKTTANGDKVIASKGTNWQLSVAGDAGHLGLAQFSYANGAVTAYSTGRIDDGAWHHIVAVADRDSSATVFVDGSTGPVTATTNTAALTSTDVLRVGAGPTSGFFAGQIDEVAVYKKVLTPARILSHYRLGAQFDATPPGITISTPANGGSVNGGTSFSGVASSESSDAGVVSVSIAPDASGGPIATFGYDEFGVPYDTGNLQRYGYLGKLARPTETLTGVIAMGARVYLPTLGRFLQPDPVDGGSANDYDYAYQDPINQYDPNGELPISISGDGTIKFPGGEMANHTNYSTIYFGRWLTEKIYWVTHKGIVAPSDITALICGRFKKVPYLDKGCAKVVGAIIVSLLDSVSKAHDNDTCLVLHWVHKVNPWGDFGDSKDTHWGTSDNEDHCH